MLRSQSKFYSDFFNFGIFGSVVAFGQGKDAFFFVGVPWDEEEDDSTVEMLLLNLFLSEILVGKVDDLFKSIE